jgi:release factor glutamine methyltransferase
LIDFAMALASPADRKGNWADLGTGSGAIAIALAQAFPEATIHAVDQSQDAIAIAEANAKALGITNIAFYLGSWFDPLEPLKGKLNGVVSNPPYIPSAMVLELQPEVRLHEPHAALDGGNDGLDCLRELVAIAPEYLVPHGLWMVEMMAGQAEAVAQLLQQQGYQRIEIRQDFAGIERFAVARK